MERVLRRSFLTGLIANGFAYSWIGHFGDKIPGGSLGILLILIPVLAVFFAFKVLGGELLARRFPSLRCLIYPSVWIIGDWIQAQGFLAFPWTYVGYSQYPFTTFIQFASITGILGVNFFIIMFNVVFADLLQYAMKKKLGEILKSVPFVKFSTTVLAFLLLILFGFFRIHGFNFKGNDSLKVAVVQTCISPWENWDLKKFLYLDELKRFTLPALAEKPEFVIWSESATLEILSYRLTMGTPEPFDVNLRQFIKNKVKVPLFTGEVGLVPGKNIYGEGYLPQNSAVLLNGEGHFQGSYAKIHLVPFGEWFPYAKWLPWVQDLMLRFGGSAFVPGKSPGLFTVKGRHFGALICYEGIFYKLCRDYENMGADFFVNITNDGWSDSRRGHYQHFAASIFRAVENGLPLVRAGNTGVSAIISALGEVEEELPILQKGHLTGTIKFKKGWRTFYSRFGDLIVFFAVFFTVFLYIWGMRRK